MARTSLAIYLVLLVALNTFHEARATFSLDNYVKNFPTVAKDFPPFAYKGTLEFMGDLESQSPGTPQFKEFFAKLKDYMAMYNSASNEMDLSQKQEKLFQSMDALDGERERTEEESWKVVDNLLSLEKGMAKMRRIGTSEITPQQRSELIGSMGKWTQEISLFVKEAAQNGGKSSGTDSDTTESPKRALRETQEAFSLSDSLKNLPKMGKDFEPFAFISMSSFLDNLESKCPKTPEFKDFFTKLEEYMACFQPTSLGLNNVKCELSVKSHRLFKAMTLLDGSNKRQLPADSWRMIDASLSMGKLLVDMSKTGLKVIDFEERKEMVVTLVKWARAVGLFVKTAAEKKGQSIDLSSLGIDHNNASPLERTSGEL